ncbi:regulatory protein spx [Virgibacillus natechei]|uniref:Regulatory protein spx n=1 Tax=Virgibacillus natechei TaxID=1216297 RepID=A0ABS4IIC5_9BACI|nr:transcriptional regulator Spx [Virgibacillus natechei]MBP1970196.1 regulatory protein spx [Virgibacillus natechei]UZD12852.1 transcriptional regulator Spx [Virgibacillus natechei]
MSVMVYGAPCSSTRKAKQWLTKHGISYVERHILKNPLTVNELHDVLRMTLDGTDEIIATRSNTYKDLNLDLDTLPLQQLLQLINKHPGLLKSPIIMDEKRIQIGYHEEDIRQFLPRKTRDYQWLQWQKNHLRLAEG